MQATEPVTQLGERFSSPDARPRRWAEARAVLEGAKLFWLSTVRPDGQPHVARDWGQTLMRQRTLTTEQAEGASGGGPLRHSGTIWLWLLIIFVGVQFGAGLYEKRVVVPQWAGLPGEQVIGEIEASGMKDAGRVFWPFVSLPVALLAVANLVLA